MRWAILIWFGGTLSAILPERYPTAFACGDAMLTEAVAFERRCLAISPFPKRNPRNEQRTD